MTAITAELQLTVPFYDADPMGVVWHGNYIKYFEKARCALLASFDYGYVEMERSGYRWPVVDMRVKYVRSAYFDQQLKVTATLLETENRLKIGFLISDAQSGQRLCVGHTIQVAVSIVDGEMCFESPPVLQQRLDMAFGDRAGQQS